MSDRLHVATRKGLFTVERRGAAWEIASLALRGDTVNQVLYDRRDGRLYACLALGHFGAKLRASTDDGQTWTELNPPVYPAGAEVGAHPMAGPDAPRQPAVLSEIWALETGGADEPGVLWAGTIPGGLFRSADGGGSWRLVESLWNAPERIQWFGGGKDQPGIHSVLVDRDDPQRLLLAVSCGGVWGSDDGGQTWSCRATGIRGDYMPPGQEYTPHIQDVHRLAAAPGQRRILWAQHHNGMFRSADGGAAWSELTDAPVSVFGFAVAVHPHQPDTAWFAPAQKDECRIPVEGRVVVTRTRDGGQTFDVLTDGLPQRHAYDLVFRHGLDVDETGEVLALGSSTGSLWLSTDGGDRWQAVSHHLPPIYAVRFVK